MASGMAPVGGSLTGTLQGMDPLTLLQAAMAQEQDAMAQNTQAATQAATQAGQEYQGAASQPAPELGMLATLIPALFGNTASVLSGNPDYAQQGQQQIKESRAGLLKTRAANLQALQDVFKQKAEAAQQAGDLEAESTARMKLESLSKTYDLVKDHADRTFDREEKEKDRKNQLEIAKLRESGDASKESSRIRREDQANRRIENSAITSMNTAVRQDPDVKNFVVVRDQLNMGIGGAAQKSNLGDILLMRALARVSDPMSSVREEEFRTFKGAQGALAQVGINLTKEMWGKGMLNEYGRVQMTDQLQNIYNTKKEQHDRAVTQYRLQAGAMGIEPDLVVRDFGVSKGNPKADAMTAARKGDKEALRALVQANPALNNDPDLLKLVRGKK